VHPRIHAENKPAAIALTDAATGVSISYGELEARANRAAHALRRLGLRNGDAVALCCDNRPEFLDIYWAAQRAGLVLVAVSSRLKASEIAYIVNDSSARVLLIASAMADTARDVATIREDMPGLTAIIGIGVIDGFPDWDALSAAEPDTPVVDEQIGGRMTYSSGTTGRPKGILYPAAEGSPIQESPAARIFGTFYHLSGETIYLSPAPLYHASPMGFVTAVQALGGTVVVMPKFDPEKLLEAIERWHVTAVQMVPTMFIRMLKLPDEVRAHYDLTSLQTVIHAAAPCPIPVKHAMIEWLGPVIEEFYAGSEGNGHVKITSEEWLRKPGSVGRAVIGQIRICGDDGHEQPIGETGTIFFSGGRSFAYHNDAGKTADSRNPLHPDWSTMGDVGRLDEDGYLFLADRKDFMIISGGVNIYPQEVENLFITHPAVADVAVFGVPNADFGEEVKAVVQPADWSQAGDALAQELIVWCKSQLADVKCPRSIDFDPALPRADTGKLFKKEIKARYWPARHLPD
jgi:long-chain acyl-CoA synthetase